MAVELRGRSLTDLGEPVQKLLRQIQRNLTDDELDVFTKIKVRQLAKVYDMLALEEDPEKILAWLKKEHQKQKGIDPDEANEKCRNKVLMEGGRDPVAYFKEIEAKNMELMASLKKAQQEREEKRAENIAERRRRREECKQRAAREREKGGNGEDDMAKMESGELSDILGVFERFTSRQSTFDNSNTVQDGEWWKRDEYRRDYESNGIRGSKWTSVVEGGSLKAPEAEIQVREEWYRVQCWWKWDAYRRNWLASRDAEWWKEEAYITDWLENGDSGSMWTAADQLTGYNHRGNRRRAPMVELDRRVQWYHANGPKGIVKTWCALTEGSKDRCTVEEMYERDDYYKNGDWWKSEIYVNYVEEKTENCSALHAASAAAMDQVWWKQPMIRADFENGGDLWKASQEEMAVCGIKNFASEAEIARRAAWFKVYWWKGEKYIQDFEKNGFKGKLWTAVEEGSSTPVDPVLLRSREEWFIGCRDTEWWKGEKCIKDWIENGDRGTIWTAAWCNASLQNDKATQCSPSVLKERVEYYKSNFWKQEKYIKDYIAFGDKGVIWKCNDPSAARESDWWKNPSFFAQWVLVNHAFPSDFWKDSDVMSDYWRNGAAGKKWTATNSVSASLERGDVEQASAEELVVRERFYLKYWWRQQEYWKDFCAKGKKWEMSAPDSMDRCSNTELKERKAHFEPPHLARAVLGYQRLLELDASTPVLGLFAPPQELRMRERYFRRSWWKTQAGLTDYAFKDSESIYIWASSFDDARSLDGARRTTAVDGASRMLYFDSGCAEYGCDNEYTAEFIAAADWWQEPIIISDYLENGDNGKKWRASNSASGMCSLADNDTASAAEIAHRKAFYGANFWRSLECLEDFCENGIRGKLWSACQPKGKGERVDEKELLLRAQILSGYPDISWVKDMSFNWWKAPEVRADFYAYGEAGSMVSAANAYAAVERLGSKMEYRADAVEMQRRVSFYKAHPLSVEDGEMCHYIFLIEPFWATPAGVEDYWTNGSAGKKWTASNASAFSCSLGDKFPATPSEVQRRERVLQSLFWRAAAYREDFLTNGIEGKLWNRSEFDGNGDVISHEEEMVRISFYLRLSEKYWADCRYASVNWWKAPEVRSDYNLNGLQGSLVGAATAAVAAMGLYRREGCAASNGEKEKRSSYFKNHLYRDSRVPQALLSRELKRVAAMGSLFWVHHDSVEDFSLHGARGTVWSAGDAASASTRSAVSFRATSDDVQIRQTFLSKFWWKASQYRLDFLQNGFKGNLWTKTAANGGGKQAPKAEILSRMCYYSCAGLECEKRLEEFALCWWKSPDAIAYYIKNADRSKYVTASSPQVALSEAHENHGMGASVSCVETRNHYMIMTAPTDITEDITDTQIMVGLKPVNDTWWKDVAYQRVYDAQRPLEHWKDSESISDYIANGAKGKEWMVAGRIFPTNMSESCGEAEKKEREAYYAINFWKSTESRDDYELNGLKGTLWTSMDLHAKGKSAPEAELNARMAYYRPSLVWELAIDPGSDDKSKWCGFHEELLRNMWYKQNWWKCALQDEYLSNGQRSVLLRSATLSIFLNGSVTASECKIEEEEAMKRLAYFDGEGDIEWWKNPAVVSDFLLSEQRGSMWNAHTLKEALLSMGLETPVDQTELERRKRWYRANEWKSLEMIQDYAAGGSKWRSGEAVNQGLREEWMRVHKPVSAEEEARRKQWFLHQLTDEQRQTRRAWLLRRAQEARRIHFSELGDLLARLNDGVRPTDHEIREIEDAIRAERRDSSIIEGITEQDVLRAMSVTNFYIEATEEEKLRSEHEALEALQKEEMDRLEEEAAHLAQEAMEELEAAGEEYVPFDELADAEEQEYLRALEEEENARMNPNEDDVDIQWELHDEEEASMGAEDPNPEETEERQRALKEAFAAEGYGGDMDEEDTEATQGELGMEVKTALEDIVKNDGWKDDDGFASNEAQREAEADAPFPNGVVLPLCEVTNPQYLKGFFTLMKYTATTSLINTSQKRIWVVDHFSQCLYNISKNNRIRKEHAAKKLIQLEKNISDNTRLRMMFYDAPDSYEMQFVSAGERERFYETVSAIRSNIRVFAPDFVGTNGAVSHVTIDGSGPNAMSVICTDTNGRPVKRQLVGECRINASKYMTETVSIWCGTFDLGGHRPSKNKEELQRWMPSGQYDIYAVGVQEASYRREENEWFDYIQDHLGGDYLPVASLFLRDLLLIVLTKKKNLLKITNIQGAAQGTVYKKRCGSKGGIAISFQYMETSICFCACHLAARTEHCELRNLILSEILENIHLGFPDADITNQFDHVFFLGNLNYRTEAEDVDLEALIRAENYDAVLAHDQLTKQRNSVGILHGFVEPTIKFAPTYRFNIGSKEYAKQNSPSYCDRILYKSMPNAWIKCTGYKSDPELLLSEHRPVSAAFLVRCVRPVMSCFMKAQKPVPEFRFDEISVKDYTGDIIKKPALRLRARFSSNMDIIPSEERNTMAPTWKKDSLPCVTCITQLQEYIETCSIFFIILDLSEKREAKKSRGTSALAMQGRVIGKEEETLCFESDIVYRGMSVGKLCGSIAWHPLKR